MVQGLASRTCTQFRILRALAYFLQIHTPIVSLKSMQKYKCMVFVRYDEFPHFNNHTLQGPWSILAQLHWTGQPNNILAQLHESKFQFQFHSTKLIFALLN